MKKHQNVFALSLVLLVTLLVGGCIRPDGATQAPAAEATVASTTMTDTTTVSDTTPISDTTAISTTAATTETATISNTSTQAAMATVSTTSLRVRAQPDGTSAVVASAKQGETYKVVGLSSDGLWVELAIDKAPNGTGWVSANFVTVQGSITDVAITNVGATPAMTETATMTATTIATPTQAMTETATTTATATATPTQAMTETATTTATTIATPTQAVIETTPLTTTTPATVTIAPPAAGMAVVKTAGPRLRVRGQPSADAPIVGYAYTGETFQVLGKSEDGKWIQIAGSTAGKGENPNGGWVAAEFLVLGQ